MVTELTNPLTKTLITRLRDQKSDAFAFRHLISELTKQLLYEALKDISMEAKKITTWRGEESFMAIDESNIVIAAVLRAALPMLESATDTLCGAVGGFLAMKRDEITHKSVLYYDRLPDCKDKTVILVDPMLATGGSMIDALDVIKTKKPKKIITLNIIGSPEGLETLSTKHNDVDIYIAQIDKMLNDDKFIIPGLGDAGDRAYNTL